MAHYDSFDGGCDYPCKEAIMNTLYFRFANSFLQSSTCPKNNPERRHPTRGFLGDAMTGDGALFPREDAVEAAWTVVNPILKNHHRALPYKRRS
jgi:glucose-6-phosphate 1-dehydrogenase